MLIPPPTFLFQTLQMHCLNEKEKRKGTKTAPVSTGALVVDQEQSTAKRKAGISRTVTHFLTNTLTPNESCVSCFSSLLYPRSLQQMFFFMCFGDPPIRV
eukprot:TRINITY_DN3153_c0_g1_i2.p1 TRINITY_DN3153_c0_g1~~TRINITY_DN3153_c0_g1_i2.p1  ORF type:complete len:100 (-),score=9.68 TRINITY_DN3153_c0_g1_i2:268-567(-)